MYLPILDQLPRKAQIDPIGGQYERPLCVEVILDGIEGSE
jgi:hypothetical protein